MAWTQLKPVRNRSNGDFSKDGVLLALYANNNDKNAKPVIGILIGESVCHEAGFVVGDRIDLAFDYTTNRMLLSRSENGSYKLQAVTHKKNITNRKRLPIVRSKIQFTDNYGLAELLFPNGSRSRRDDNVEILIDRIVIECKRTVE